MPQHSSNTAPTLAELRKRSAGARFYCERWVIYWLGREPFPYIVRDVGSGVRILSGARKLSASTVFARATINIAAISAPASRSR
jgi:hypothetical protein